MKLLHFSCELFKVKQDYIPYQGSPASRKFTSMYKDFIYLIYIIYLVIFPHKEETQKEV